MALTANARKTSMKTYYEGNWRAEDKKYARQAVRTLDPVVRDILGDMGICPPEPNVMVLVSEKARKVSIGGATTPEGLLLLKFTRGELRRREIEKGDTVETYPHELTHLARYKATEETGEDQGIVEYLGQEGLAYLVGKAVAGQVLGKEFDTFYEVTRDLKGLRGKAQKIFNKVRNKGLVDDELFEYLFFSEKTMDKRIGEPVLCAWASAEIRGHMQNGATFGEMLDWPADELINCEIDIAR